MSDYGLTPKGPNIKRLDKILDDMHTELSEKLGVNTKQNSQSLLNVLLTNFADRIAELWEFGEAVYHSQYPSSAEGTSLDSAAQFGGIIRETASRSYYPIHCTGTDGTVLVAGTQIATKTNPKVHLSITEENKITRSSFNSVQIKVASPRMGDTYTAVINGTAFSFVAVDAVPLNILNGLAEAITTTEFAKSINQEDLLLILSANDISINHNLVLSENLTTEVVTSVITFGTDELGNIFVPDGTITEIVQADAGLLSVINRCEYIAGRNAETDTELRKSYADKIFNRSSLMLESIKSAILNNVQGVESVAAYENTTDYATMKIICTGDETQGHWYYFKYDDLYFLFSMPSVVSGDTLIFGSSHKKLTLQHNNTTTELPLTVSYTAPSEWRYYCTGTETQGALYYFLQDNLYYIFSMPSVASGDRFVFDVANKELKHIATGSTTSITLEAGFEPPHNLKYTVTGNETGLLWYFKYKNVYYSLTFGSAPTTGTVITFDTETKAMSRIYNTTTTALSPVMSETAPFNLEYTADGTETAKQFSYFSYGGLYYLFELPNLNSGDKIVFDTETKSLKRIRSGSPNYTIDVTTAFSSPQYFAYQYQQTETAGAVYYFKYKDYKDRYCAFLMPDDQEITFDGLVFYPVSGELFYTNSGVETALECTITDTAPTGTNITPSSGTAYGTNMTSDFEQVTKGRDITSSLASLSKTAENITSSVISSQIEATDLTSKIITGMPPHSIEVVVEGGDSTEIAQQILNNKAGGITTYGSIPVTLATSYGEEVTVNFNRPIKTYVWFKLSLTLRANEQLPDNYATLLKDAILEQIDSLNSGDDVVPQEFMSELYEACAGIAYIDISLFGTNLESATPSSYPSRVIEISDRQRAYTTASMIEVVIPSA